MPRYHYSGRDAAGLQVAGDMEAATEAELTAALLSRRVTPTAISPSATGGTTIAMFGARSKISTRDLLRIAKRMHYLLHAGMDLARALRLLEAQQTSRQVGSFLGAIRQQVQSGRSLTAALASTGQPIPPYLVGIMQAGESSGALDQAFNSISLLLERRLAIQGKLISALVYPTILFVASILTIVMLSTTVIPRFQPIFEQAGASLPLITRIVVAFSDAVRIGWAPAMILAGALAISWHHFSRKEESSVRLHGWLLGVPLVGSLLRKTAYARLATLWAAQLRGGVSLTQAMRLSLEGIGNRQIRHVVQRARERIVAGATLAKALSRDASVPAMFVEFVDLGEQTGRLSETLAELAKVYEAEIDEDIQRGLSLITPLATLLLGGMVATVLAALLSAVMAVNDLAI